MYINKTVAVVADGVVAAIYEVGAPPELSDGDALAYAVLMGKVSAAGQGLAGDVVGLDNPEVMVGDGYDGQAFTVRPELRMTPAQRVLAGYDPPPEGYVIRDGALSPMTDEERLAAGLVSQEEYDAALSGRALAEAEAELDSKISTLMSVESAAKAEVDPDYAAARKASLAALLEVRNQPGWPNSVVWPE